MSHQTPQGSTGRYGKSPPGRGRMPICRRCRKAPATVNAFCDVCYDAQTRAKIIEDDTAPPAGLWDGEI